VIIQKDYKFYAAHRNEQLDDKCRNLHGHRYGLSVFFEVHRNGSYSTLFSKFDEKIEPFLKRYYDHGMMIHCQDPLLPFLQQYMQQTGDNLKLNIFGAPTSVENLAYKLFCEISELGFSIERIEVRETDTSVVCYSREDWQTDCRNAQLLSENPARPNMLSL
jgi:6-pyruvoyltetrahydropterin/6-carboxytetrahydropterin synthase